MKNYHPFRENDFRELNPGGDNARYERAEGRRMLKTDVASDLDHPDVHRPWSHWSESETVHLVIAYSNPFRWDTRRRLANNAIRHLRNTPNVRLYVAELAYGDRPFELTGEHPDDVQLRTDSELWHKENIIKIATQRFPAGWKYGGYCDADFTFTRHDWALEGIHLLQHYDWVQGFSSYTDLSGKDPSGINRPCRMMSSFAWNRLHEAEVAYGRGKHDERKLIARLGCDPQGYGALSSIPAGSALGELGPGATGGMWLYTRTGYETVGGLLDTCILGSADWHMSYALVQKTNWGAELKRCTSPYVASLQRWQIRAMNLQRGVGCIDQHAVHHWHGSKTLRAYGERWHILRKHNFDPLVDLQADYQGIWKLSGNKPGLRDDLRRYFAERSEDNPNLMGHEKTIV